MNGLHKPKYIHTREHKAQTTDTCSNLDGPYKGTMLNENKPISKEQILCDSTHVTFLKWWKEKEKRLVAARGREWWGWEGWVWPHEEDLYGTGIGLYLDCGGELDGPTRVIKGDKTVHTCCTTVNFPTIVAIVM